jgi:hypothetical protein
MQVMIAQQKNHVIAPVFFQFDNIFQIVYQLPFWYVVVRVEIIAQKNVTAIGIFGNYFFSVR